MSLTEGKDNLAYRNYKMSDDFKNRMMQNYMQMLNESEKNENNMNTMVSDNSNVVGFDEVERRRTEKELAKKNRNFDGLIKVCVASFAIIASIGAVKFGLDSYIGIKNGTKTASKKVASKDSKKVDDILGESTTSENAAFNNDVNDFPKVYPDCYDADGNLLEGYEIYIISAEVEGETVTKKIVGRDIVEISGEEYNENYKALYGSEQNLLDDMTYVYYLQGNKFCRTSCYAGFPTEVYSYKEIEHIAKHGTQLYVYPLKTGKYEDRANTKLPDNEYFHDCNMVDVTKIAINKGDETIYKYASAIQKIFRIGTDDKEKVDLLFIDDNDILWGLEDVDTVDTVEDADYIYNAGKNYKEVKFAENCKVDEAHRFSIDTIFIEGLEGFKRTDATCSYIKYKGIDY